MNRRRDLDPELMARLHQAAEEIARGAPRADVTRVWSADSDSRANARRRSGGRPNLNISRRALRLGVAAGAVALAVLPLVGLTVLGHPSVAAHRQEMTRRSGPSGGTSPAGGSTTTTGSSSTTTSTSRTTTTLVTSGLLQCPNLSGDTQLEGIINSDLGGPADCWQSPNGSSLLYVVPGTSYAAASASQPAGGSGVLVFSCTNSDCSASTPGLSSIANWTFYAAPQVGYVGDISAEQPSAFPAGAVQVGPASTVYFDYSNGTFFCGNHTACTLNPQQSQEIDQSVVHLEMLTTVMLP